MDDGLTTSVITERWSGHANIVISNDALKKLYGLDNKLIFSPEPNINSLWGSVEPKGSSSYGFQKGYLTFTTAPPQCGINRLADEWATGSQTFPRTVSKNNRITSFKLGEKMRNTCSSSEESPSKLNFHSMLPVKRVFENENDSKRCKSTCNITLTWNQTNEMNPEPLFYKENYKAENSWRNSDSLKKNNAVTKYSLNVLGKTESKNNCFSKKKGFEEAKTEKNFFSLLNNLNKNETCDESLREVFCFHSGLFSVLSNFNFIKISCYVYIF